MIACKSPVFHRIYMIHSNDQNQQLKSPAQEFAPLAATFQRRLLLGVGSASLVALGANFGGLTSFLIGLSPQTGRALKLDVLYPIRGYSRYIDTNEGFEFVYPADWVGDQTLLYRAAKKSELQRSLDPPPLNPNKVKPNNLNVNEPVVAFGPPGSTGELNVSVIVSPVPRDFSIQAFGEPEQVGESIVKKVTGSGRRSDINGSLIKSRLREDLPRSIKYYEIEFRVESPTFQRHNVAVCCARNGRLYTLNAQAPESMWPQVQSDLHSIAQSFNLTS